MNYLYNKNNNLPVNQVNSQAESPQKKKNEWKALSARIDTLKKKIENSQDEIVSKDEFIKRLNEKITKF